MAKLMGTGRAGVTVGALIVLAAALPAAAESWQASADITLASDYMFRGVSQTMSGPALQAGAVLSHDSGWYGYGWASNVDFTSGGTPDDGARLELDLGLGYDLALGERANLSLEWVNYLFPNTRRGYDYDYGEWLTRLTLDERHSIAVGFSEDVFASGSAGVWYAAATGFAAAQHLWVDMELGYFDLENGYDMSYSYAELAVAGTLARMDWRLSYFTTAGAAARLFDSSTVSDRVVLALSVAF